MSRLLLLAGLLLAASAYAQDKPRYSEEQLTRLRELVNNTRDSATALQTRLERQQRALAQLYDNFDLDEEKARKLQAGIVETQRQLLENHHRMQAELRGIVAKEQFDVLKQRIKGVLQPAPKTTDTRPAPPPEKKE